MKLNISKTSTIELEPLSDTGGTSAHGRQFSVASGEDSPRLSTLVNNAVRAHFAMPDQMQPTAARRRAAATVADKIQPAIFKDRESQLLRVVYKEIAVRFAKKTSGKTRKDILAKYGMTIRRHGQFDQALHIVYDPNRKILGEQVVEVANRMMMLDEVEVASPNFVSEFPRSRVPAPSVAQWHLSRRPGGSAKKDCDVDIGAAWKTTMGSPQIVVAILDDGVDVEHPNLRENILSRPDADDARDLVGRDFFIADDSHPDHFNPRPKRFQFPYDRMDGNDIHGTPCAGVVAASGRVGDTYGAAPRCRILPVKVFHADDLASEARVADAIAYAARFADILSCSWSGPRSALIEAALRDAAGGAAHNRRRERGTPVFVAAGNESAGSVSYPAASSHAICVGATTDQAVVAGYSNQGPEVWISAPSSGGRLGITTTDVSYANRGFNVGAEAAGGTDGLHTNDFGGTSSATPLAAGVAALVLSVNAELSCEEVKEVLKATADKIGPKTSYKGNPGRSRAYGYGKVNAGAAVAAAAARRREA